MFTVKLMRGENNAEIHVLEAMDVRIQRSQGADINSAGSAVIVNPGRGDFEQWFYVGNNGNDPTQYRLAVIENAAGKTTEVVRP
jgi:hypothetical protein